MTFKEFLALEGGFISDSKAEQGKSRVNIKKAPGPKDLIKPSGVAGGPGPNTPAGGGITAPA